MAERQPYISVLFPGSENNGRFNEPILDYDYPEREGAAMYARLKDLLRFYGVRTDVGEIPPEIRSLALKACYALRGVNQQAVASARTELLICLQTVQITIMDIHREFFEKKTPKRIRTDLLHEVQEFFKHEDTQNRRSR